jgi:glutathione S-transferase
LIENLYVQTNAEFIRYGDEWRQIETPDRLRCVDLQRGQQLGADFLSRNALGRVPLLEDGTFVLTENVAILTYLGRRYPDAGLMPADAKNEARCIEWLA